MGKLNIFYKNMSSKETLRHIYYDLGQITLLVLLVSLISLYNYNLSYSLVQIVIIAVSFGIFAVSWNSRRFIANKFFVFIGISFFFVSFVEALHLFSFSEFSVFGENSMAMRAQFWVLARLLESLSVFLAIFYISRPLKSVRLFYIYLSLISLPLLLIFWQPIFIISYWTGPLAGILKLISEAVIIFLYVGSVTGLYLNKEKFNGLVFNIFISALALNISGELILSFYLDISSVPNILIYSLKIISFSLFYIAIVEMGLRKPYSILFKELKDAEKKSEHQVERLQELTNDLDKFKIAVENTVDMVIISDDANTIVFANPAVQSISGYKPEEVIGVNAAVLGEKMKTLEYEKIWKIVSEDKKPFRGEIQKKKKEGDMLIVDVQAYPIMNNGEIMFCIYIERDITEAKRMDRAKSEFISLASHQLRTPLTSVALASELLLKSVGDSVNKKQKGYLQEINDSTSRMMALINNLLNVSRIDMDSFATRLELIDVVDSVDQIVRELDSQIKAKRLQLTKDYQEKSFTALFDKDVLRIVVENLLANAIMYTPQGGRIGVRISSSARDLVVAVSDTGYGIPPACRDKIFSKFFRADNAREVNREGNGLGLYIAKEMAGKIGSRIWFELPEEGGTIFFLLIPIKKPL